MRRARPPSPRTRRVVKQLEHVLLHAGRVARAQHREQLVVADEVEAGEGATLGVEVVAQRLLAQLQLLRERAQLVKPGGASDARAAWGSARVLV